MLWTMRFSILYSLSTYNNVFNMATSVNNCSVKISKRANLNEKRAHFLDFYKSEGAPCPSAPPVPRPMTGCRAKSKFQVDFPLKKYFMHKNIKCKTIIKEHYSVKNKKIIAQCLIGEGYLLYVPRYNFHASGTQRRTKWFWNIKLKFRKFRLSLHAV